MELEAMKSRALANWTQRDKLVRGTKARLTACRPNSPEGSEALREAFALIVAANSNAVALGQAVSIAWGFTGFDARFLGSLHDQQQGVGQAQRDLTRSQLATIRTVLMSEAYLTQVALLWS